MSDTQPPAFTLFLEQGLAKGGFEADDVLAAMLPLMKQVSAAHAEGAVAPLKGIHDLRLSESRHLEFDPSRTRASRKNNAKVAAMQEAFSRAVEVVGQFRRTTDLDAASSSTRSLEVAASGENLAGPAFLPNYESWEHAVGHHDELTDVFSLGLLLASLACGLDFADEGELELFATSRGNLFALNHRINPVIASVIVQMTQLNRHKRAQDLGQLIVRLETYREQPAELRLDSIKGFKESDLSGKRRLIQTHLRDRLFEISRRNRLIYFKPSLQTLNLTVASVPLMLDYRNIRLEQLFVWHSEMAAIISDGSPMSLGKYLRFEDAPYIPGALDKIISEARRDRAEYGFAQLRLAICFLRWTNLKEAPQERIHSPLLLLPVELTKKKGVRDNYVLTPSSSEAEVNPALRHHLKELFNLDLPVSLDLRETTLDQFHQALQAGILASEPGVTLAKVERPQIQLIHERARQRVDQYRRRMKVSAHKTKSTAKPDYSYDRDDYQPLGLRLFLDKVRPAPIPLRDLAGAEPRPRNQQMLETPGAPQEQSTVEMEREMFALREGDNQNPYAWEFDLCSITLGNFNYRKMTLVRDYAKLMETDMASRGFDSVFSLAPKSSSLPEERALSLQEQRFIVACDATQASAIARARSGRSYIIQGPPGTGKSQTITNLIADYVACGKRVLFVCEKRAAIDVVFHRLRQSGLDELCCLIHDSQTDKKAFIQNLKQTYETFLSQPDPDPGASPERLAALRSMEEDLQGLSHFSDAMSRSHPETGLPLRALLHRLIELGGDGSGLSAVVEELLPFYPDWMRHGDLISRLGAAMADLGLDPCFASHAFRWLGPGVLEADRPLETLYESLDQAEDLLDGVETAFELSGVAAELARPLRDIRAILQFALRARPLAERNLLGVLEEGSISLQFAQAEAELDACAGALQQAAGKNTGWKDPLTEDDAQNALTLATSFEASIFKFFHPGFWRLRKMLGQRYDFTRHAVAPAWTKMLQELLAEHSARKTLLASQNKMAALWRTVDLPAFRSLVAGLKADRVQAGGAVKDFMARLAARPDASELIVTLADIHDEFARLEGALGNLFVRHEQFEFRQLVALLSELRDQSGVLPDMFSLLSQVSSLPPLVAHALRSAPIPLGRFEAAIARKSVNEVFRRDRKASRFDGRALQQRMERLEESHAERLALNARCIRVAVRQKFLEHVQLSEKNLSQLEPDQKSFKKAYSAGRRELENEFGKTMRYKSIRDLAAGPSGGVIKDLKPVWLMSPLSVSDTLPLDPEHFDVVIFDEASQIPVEEAIPAIYRSHQVIVVGDEMQLPPTTFFAGSRADEDSVFVESDEGRFEIDLDSDSFLSQAGTNLPSTLLAWHYRSRYEALISFSNAAFYSGGLFTIPDRQIAAEGRGRIEVTSTEQGEGNVDALLARSVSFHHMVNGVYEDRRNHSEAAYIARLVRGLLQRGTKLNIGVVAFSEAQQGEIEEALQLLAGEDAEFAAKLEAEFQREENDQFCGLFVKNLENVQGDERDIILMSVCYGNDSGGRMLMNFGPINQRGGEKRLNVIFSRARRHMALVSSIRHHQITNHFNDGANSLRNFLQYAEAVSTGDAMLSRQVLEGLNPLSRKALAPLGGKDQVVSGLAEALRSRGHEVDLNVGQSRFRCDLAIRGATGSHYALGILVDTDGHYANPNLMDRYLMQPSILRAFGWRFTMVLTKDWYLSPEDVLRQVDRALKSEDGDSKPAKKKPESKEPAAEPESSVSATDAATAESSALAEAAPDPVVPAVLEQLPKRIRRFEFSSGSSQKFWEASVVVKSFEVRFGRVNTEGQLQTKTFATEELASKEMEKLIREKLQKGYTECPR